LSRLLSHVRNIARTLARKPAFTLLTLLLLAVGIGTGTAIVSVADAVLLRPLPYPDPERLVFVWNRLSNTGVEKSAVAPGDYLDYLRQSRLFEDFAAFYTTDRVLTEEGVNAASLRLAWTTASYFSLLGVEPLLGDVFRPEEESRLPRSAQRDPGFQMPSQPVVLSYELWQGRYGADPAILGRTVEIDGQPALIRGVLPEGFRLHLPADVVGSGQRIDAWSPFPFAMRETERTVQWLKVFARLKPGVRLAEAQAEMDAIAARQRELSAFHERNGIEIRVRPMLEEITAQVRSSLFWLSAGVGLLLLLIFSNVTHLSLLHNWARQRETAIRLALGGNRRQVMARALGESAALAVLGGVLGLSAAHGGIRLLLLLQPKNLPRIEEAGLSWTMLAVALGIAVAAGALCGLVPALQASRPNLATITSERSSTGGRAHHRLRKGLVVTEIAAAFVLLVHTGLILRTVVSLQHVDAGFRPENVLVVKMTMPASRYPRRNDQADVYELVRQRLAVLPGVTAVGGVHPLPLGAAVQDWWGPWAVEGMDQEKWADNAAGYRTVVPGYFEAMGIRLLRGRTFRPDDVRRDAPKVVIVDELMARRAWPDEPDPVGKRWLGWGFGDGDLVPHWMTVVGVVGHVRDVDLTRDGLGTVYCPQRHFGYQDMSLTLKSATSNPLGLVDSVRAALAEIDPDVPFQSVRLMQDYVDDKTANTRFVLILFGVFAAVATVLAMVGLYGVMAFAVRERTHEMGVRMAFGAGSGKILWMVLRQSTSLALAGLALGVGGSLFLTRGLESLLYTVTPRDPLTFVAVSVVMLTVALLASLVPAWRATRVDPVQVLQSE